MKTDTGKNLVTSGPVAAHLADPRRSEYLGRVIRMAPASWISFAGEKNILRYLRNASLQAKVWHNKRGCVERDVALNGVKKMLTRLSLDPPPLSPSFLVVRNKLLTDSSHTSCSHQAFPWKPMLDSSLLSSSTIPRPHFSTLRFYLCLIFKDSSWPLHSVDRNLFLHLLC